jgi:hypothetical protein
LKPWAEHRIVATHLFCSSGPEKIVLHLASIFFFLNPFPAAIAREDSNNPTTASLLLFPKQFFCFRPFMGADVVRQKQSDKKIL